MPGTPRSLSCERLLSPSSRRSATRSAPTTTHVLAAKRLLVDTICLALEIHAQLEEEIFYPAIREFGRDADMVGESIPEHDEMRSRRGAPARRRPRGARRGDDRAPPRACSAKTGEIAWNTSRALIASNVLIGVGAIALVATVVGWSRRRRGLPFARRLA